jgi:hypothetical protein
MKFIILSTFENFPVLELNKFVDSGASLKRTKKYNILFEN